jgi:hypothetical protein
MDLLTLLGDFIAEMYALAEEPDLTAKQKADICAAIEHLERCRDRI